MTSAAAIDLFLTPILGGVGAFIGVSWAARRKQEPHNPLSALWVRLLIGGITGCVLFATKLF